ncbi:phenylacetate--CoA ligase [Bacillus canaveralius]|uniref:Phenylacetate-coenzyme A ligase n=1 Tax=Bacillus canaveralius TaxID=1403243 RepID=A0A2N5GLJ8_9BACI|nr:AMP-binding protein [Bacillus canaveralius]PLR82512.1 phenylacetate--CoA ligase [Bacillus canaveralius]PLR95683.1 phenylacetate--CoA ligase [Bacillus canaveralius]
MIIDSIETATRTEIRSLQQKRLKKTTERVYQHVPFYRKKFNENGFNPERNLGLNDMVDLPFTTKADLRKGYPFGLLAVPKTELVRLHASSGTSGKPTVVGYTKHDIEMWSEIVARSIATAGGEPGEILHNAYGYGLFTGGLGLHYGSERLGMVTVPISGGNTQRQIMLIEDFQPTVICGTPSYVLNIAETMEEMGKKPAATSLRYGILGAEPWSEEMRRKIEEKLAIKACDIYGLSEVIGPGVAIECHEEQNGLHIAEDHFYAEVIDPETLEPLADGDDGELVFTSLTKEAFPVIRYRTGDVASLNKEKCRCGRTTARMSRIKGRIDDMLNVNGVNVFPSEIEHSMLKMKELAPHYQIHMLQKRSFKVLELHVEITEECFKAIDFDLAHDKIRQLERKLKAALKSSCLIAMDTVIREPKSIPRSEGKALRVIDRRNEQGNFAL